MMEGMSDEQLENMVRGERGWGFGAELSGLLQWAFSGNMDFRDCCSVLLAGTWTEVSPNLRLTM